ncbi:MAG: site-specific DNA-methyltransferase [Candidatus Poribacteria bacterium]|nr:site-specific DNA-methyltransferase [Candidatus Poribacteria bacterium]
MYFPLDMIKCGDAFSLIRDVDDECVDLVITSPPYFQQRGYGGGAAEIGSEPTVGEYIERLIELFRDCVRVTKPSGSLVFNLGDKYDNGSLLLVPYRFALAATETDLVKLVNEITWTKRNPTPRQFRRRLVSSTEPFFHFVKTDNYYYDLDSFLSSTEQTKKQTRTSSKIGQRYFELISTSELSEGQKDAARTALSEVIQEVISEKIAGFRMKIRGIHSEPFGGQEGGRKIQLEKNGFTIIRLHGNPMKRDVIESPVESIKGSKHPAIYPVSVVTELLILLTPKGGIVLDPFMGSGSTAIACKLTDRHYIGFELNPEYCEEAEQRLRRAQEPLMLF